MSWLGKYWKVLLAVILLIAAVIVLLLVYKPARALFEQQVETTVANTALLQLQLDSQLEQNAELELIKDDLGPALADIEAAEEKLAQNRELLYSSFPGGLLEEDQILYVLDLEDILDMEIMFGRTYDSLSGSQGRDVNFIFGSIQPINYLTDGSVLCSVNIDIDFDMPYDAFKDMLVYLTNDERITSINYTKIDYDPVNNRVVGYATLLYYYLDSEAVPYGEPVFEGENPGKSTLFE